MRNKAPDRLQSVGPGKFGFSLGWDQLMATHSDQAAGGSSRSSDVSYIIRDNVRHGRLEDLETGRQVIIS